MAETGLLFVENNYDKERYEEFLQISMELLQLETGVSEEVVKDFFRDRTEYPTPNVDVRGVLLNRKNEILLVQEQIDSKWTIPGGWCEIGYTPKENIKKEMQEETGLNVDVKQLLAVFDKKCHNHPPQPHYVYKLCYLCVCDNPEALNPNFEIKQAKYFSIDALPELSEDRILKNQIELLYHKIANNDYEVYSD